MAINTVFNQHQNTVLETGMTAPTDVTNNRRRGAVTAAVYSSRRRPTFHNGHSGAVTELEPGDTHFRSNVVDRRQRRNTLGLTAATGDGRHQLGGRSAVDHRSQTYAAERSRCPPTFTATGRRMHHLPLSRRSADIRSESDCRLPQAHYSGAKFCSDAPLASALPPPPSHWLSAAGCN